MHSFKPVISFSKYEVISIKSNFSRSSSEFDAFAFVLSDKIEERDFLSSSDHQKFIVFFKSNLNVIDLSIWRWMIVAILLFLWFWVHFFWTFRQNFDSVVIFLESVKEGSAVCTTKREEFCLGFYCCTCKFRPEFHDIIPAILWRDF